MNHGKNVGSNFSR